MNEVLLGALGGGLLGLVSGFIVSIVTLQLRRLRNAVLMRRGCAPLKDAIRPPLHVPGTLFGLLLGGVLPLAMPLPPAIAIAGGVLPALLLLLIVGVSLRQAVGGQPLDTGLDPVPPTPLTDRAAAENLPGSPPAASDWCDEPPQG